MADLSREWVIFDGDNTLWNVESLYDLARSNLCNLVKQMGGSWSAADQFQRVRDAELYEIHGYGARRFPQSFVDTVRHCLGLGEIQIEKQARLLASEVFRTNPPLARDLDVMLDRLNPHYHLALLTAGDPEVQAHRLAAFGRTDLFEVVRIVERKSQETLRTFLEEHMIKTDGCWVVGDSIRSDIEPASGLGVRAIHLNMANWHPVETAGRKLPSGVQSASSLLEVCAILGC